MSVFPIKLMDGREIEGFLKPTQPQTIQPDNLSLDTTGQYLTFGSVKPKAPSEDQLTRAERQYNHHLFTGNAWFLLANAEKILSDSRMFLTPVKVRNGLAYTGTSGLGHPTVGVYLEWWLNFQDAAVDRNGNLVWYISGSPLSGANCCSSVTPEGEHVKIAQRTPFSDIWGSFMKVNNRYTEAKQRCEAYTLEELLIELHGADYKYSLVELKHEMIEKIMADDKNHLQKLYHRLVDKVHKLINDNRRLQLRHCREEILEFYKGYAERQKVVLELEKKYVARHRELKKQLRDGTLEADYHLLLAEASREYKARKREQSDLLNKFIRTHFDKSLSDITPTDVIRYATGKPLSTIPI